MTDETITLELQILDETAFTILVTDGDVRRHLPKSAIDYDEGWDEGYLCDVTVPEWLAKDRGLV